jgi:isoleucyl-tRNA synthetase
MIVLPADETQAKALRRFEAHILEELNVKKLTIAADLGALVSYEVKPNMKLLGPKYGKDAGEIRKLLEREDPAKVAQQVAKGAPLALKADGRGWELLPAEIVVVKKEAAGCAVSEERGLAVALNCQITPELEREGLSRDIVRHIQQIRKELDLDMMDHINVAYETSDETLLRAIEENRQHIRGETLCNDLIPGHSESAKEIALSGRDIRLMVQKVG